MAERPLDIFNVLEKLDVKDTKFYNTLTDKEKKGFAPIVVTRWLSGTSNKQQVIFINEIVNPYIFSLHKHPELLWYLLNDCTTGKKQRYLWNKTITKESGTSACIACIKEYFHYNLRNAEMVWRTIDHMLVLEMAEELGYQVTEMNRVRKELGLQTSTKGSAKTRKEKEIPEYGDISNGFEF